MSQMTVEEILSAVRQLPSHERRRLSEPINREREFEPQENKPQASPLEFSQPRPSDEIPASREAEMQWLLDHPHLWDQHRGEHVALWGYEMIAVGKDAKEVYAKEQQRGIKYPFVQYLPVHEQEWYLDMSNQPLVEP